MIERASVLDFLRESRSEMRRVVWPSRPATFLGTRVVLTALCAVAVAVAVGTLLLVVH